MNQKYSFIEFLSKPLFLDNDHVDSVIIDKVEIPIIQRDYAQGRLKTSKEDKNRKTLNETGKRFIKTIFEHLENGSEMEMDFVYGSVYDYTIKRGKDEVTLHGFQPLDGQQRLTTLFLLHWYIGMRETNEKLPELKRQLMKFSYETRTSSRQFCEDLCRADVSEFTFETLISDEISDCAWFYKSYHKDPTISAMLNMLNEIQALYEGFEANNEGIRLFERLDSLKFYPFPLNGFNLSEDLYIKMNARGKQLTDFENFKADLINWMKSDKNPEKDKFNQVPEGKALPFYLGISMKIDNEWTKLFWRITKDYDPELRDPKTKQLIYPDGKLVDPLFMRFFKRYFHLRNILTTEERVSVEQLADDPVVKYFYGAKGADEATIYDSNDFETNYVKSLSYDCIRDIECILDRLCEEFDGKTVFDIVSECMNAPWAEDKEKQFYSPRIEQTGRMALCACFEYLKWNEFNAERFHEWMRVIWNFIDEPSIRTVVGMIGALRFIQNIGDHSGDIYTYLTTVKDEDRPKRFAEQFGEEVIKAKLIRGDQDADDISWESLIKDAELIPVFKGRIISLLEEGEGTTKETFKNRLESVKKIFEGNDLSNSTANFTWVRAMLTYCTGIDATKQLSLENGKQDNWRFLIGRPFIEPFRALVNGAIGQHDVKNWMESRCNNYVPSSEMSWITPLIKWKDGNGETLLGHYSDNNRILQTNNGYFLLKTIQYSEGVIFLSNRRNELVKELLRADNVVREWDIKAYEGVICGEFFRGSNIELSREVALDDIKLVFKYVITPENMIVGLKADERKRHLFRNYLISAGLNPDDKMLSWIDKREYDYAACENFEVLIAKIENDVFSADCKTSLYYQLKTAFKSETTIGQ